MATTYSDPRTRGARPTRATEVIHIERFKDAMSWSAILGAGAISIGLLFLATSLWNAMAYSSGYSWVADNVAWFHAGTAIVTLLIAGLLAGWLSSSGLINGMLHGMAVWGVFIAGAVVFHVGSAFPLTTLSDASTTVTNASPASYWPTFVAYSIGLLAAVVGGTLGAMIPHRDVAVNDDVIDLREPELTREPELRSGAEPAASRFEFDEHKARTVGSSDR